MAQLIFGQAAPHDKCDRCGTDELPRAVVMHEGGRTRWCICLLCIAALIESITPFRVTRVFLNWLHNSRTVFDQSTGRLVAQARNVDPKRTIQPGSVSPRRKSRRRKTIDT